MIVKTSDLDPYLSTLALLVRQPSVVGAERPFLASVRRELEALGIRCTAYEGVLVAEGSEPTSGYVSVHVDRHGLVCTGPGEFQYAAYVAGRRQDDPSRSISEQMLETLDDRFTGASVEAYEPWNGSYLGHGTILAATRCARRQNVVFDVVGLDHVQPGIAVAYSDRLRIDGDLVSAQLDNVLWVAGMIELYRRGFTGTAFFSTQEEAGRSWRFVLEWFLRHDRSTRDLIVLDTSPFDTQDEADAQQVVLRNRDANGAFDPALVERLKNACLARDIRHRFKDESIAAANREREARGEAPRSLGITELGRLVAASAERIGGATLQVPTTGYHTASECTRASSIRAAFDVLTAVLPMEN